MVNIAIIGSGQIGSRHLQSLALLRHSANIFLVDPSESALEISKKRFFEVYHSGDGVDKNIFPHKTIENINAPIDIAIIATSSDCRAKAIKDLLAFQKVKRLILEKILFQKIDDYFEVKDLFEKNKTQAWVNCYMRTVPFFRAIKQELDQQNDIIMTVDGSRWDMATTGIHYIDLFAFLTGSSEFSITEAKLMDCIIDSKRDGFKEFFGEITGKNSKKDTLRLICDSKGDALNRISIVNGNKHKEVVFGPNDMTYSYGTGELSNHEKIETPLQSRLTHQIIHQIIESGTCDLSSYDESMGLHLPFIKTALNYFKNQLNQEIEACPIT